LLTVMLTLPACDAAQSVEVVVDVFVRELLQPWMDKSLSG